MKNKVDLFKQYSSIFLLLLFGDLMYCQNQVYKENYQDGNLKISGYFNLNGEKEGEWIVLDSINLDTISLLTYINGTLNGEFIDFYIGTNHRSKYVTSQLHNYSDWQEETFKVEGYYKNNILHGNYIEYYQNGQIHLSGIYVQGLKSGEFIEYHDNGHKRLIQNYKEGTLVGDWQQFYNTGKLREKRFYKNGIHITSEITEWYENGVIKNCVAYVIKDEKTVNHGKSVTYYENGNIQISSFYENGKPNGKWKGFYKDGTLKYKTIYKNSIHKSYIQFDENGKKKQD